MKVPKNIKIKLSFDSAILLLDIYVKETKSLSQKDIYIPILIATIFTIVKIWKQPKCLLIDEYIKTILYIYNGILSRHKKMNFCHLQKHERNWGHYAKWNVRQSKTKIVLSHLYVKWKKLIDTKNRWVVWQRQGLWVGKIGKGKSKDTNFQLWVLGM